MAYGSYGDGYQFNDGNPNSSIFRTQGVPQTATATATLTAFQLSYGILVGNPSTTAATYTFPTGALLDVEFSNAQPNSAFDCSIINLGTSSGVITVAAGTGTTLVGSATIAITSSSLFRFRKTDVNTWIVYRIG
jgi:hypothetical protein